MAWREVAGRYQGSIMGLLWSFVHPILMLIVYTFVFSVVFKAKWGIGGDSKISFGIVLFTGLIVHGLLAEVFNRAPSLILNNISYVKKVVFPLEILPIISIVSALFHSAISLIILLLAVIIYNGSLHWTIVLIPIVFLPFLILILGGALILTSLGVFIRDIEQTIGIVTTVMLFLSPVFYPLSIIPEVYHPYILANPLTFIIEQSREILLLGGTPNWGGLGVYLLIAIVLLWLGFFLFQKTRKGFADVL